MATREADESTTTQEPEHESNPSRLEVDAAAYKSSTGWGGFLGGGSETEEALFKTGTPQERNDVKLQQSMGSPLGYMKLSNLQNVQRKKGNLKAQNTKVQESQA